VTVGLKKKVSFGNYYNQWASFNYSLLTY